MSRRPQWVYLPKGLKSPLRKKELTQTYTRVHILKFGPRQRLKVDSEEERKSRDGVDQGIHYSYCLSV